MWRHTDEFSFKYENAFFKKQSTLEKKPLMLTSETQKIMILWHSHIQISSSYHIKPLYVKLRQENLISYEVWLCEKNI